MGMNLFNIDIGQVRQYSWRHVFEHMGRLKWLLTRVSLVVTGHLTTEIGLAVQHIAREVFTLRRKSGLLFTAQYLKQANVSLMRYRSMSSAKQRVAVSNPVSISLTRSGIPRIIPPLHRKILSKGGVRGDYLVSLYLSLFSVYRIICLAPPLSVSSLKTIGHSVTGGTIERSFSEEFLSKVPSILKKYLTAAYSIPLHFGVDWVPHFKSFPTARKFKLPNGKVGASLFVQLHDELTAFSRDRTWKFWTLGGWTFDPQLDLFCFSKGALWPGEVEYNNKQVEESVVLFDEDSDSEDDFSITSSSDCPSDDRRRLCGRLSAVVEGGGKRRVFCIGNYLSQRMLYPVHKWAMEVLSSIPTDGTFDQQAPLLRLASRSKGKTMIFSYDLKSATDRFPRGLIQYVFEIIFGKMASDVFLTILFDTFFDPSAVIPKGAQFVLEGSGPDHKPDHNYEIRMLPFAQGQGLGFLSSWPLFTLTHHLVVWVAAELVKPGRPLFRDYALLGDDIVIADVDVAKKYRSILDAADVQISEAKSLVSDLGCLEFAKRFWVNGLSLDLSPVSARALMLERTPLAILAIGRRYPISDKTAFRLAGAGYRVRAKLTSLSRKWQRLSVVLSYKSRGKLPLEWWLGGGLPLSPNLKGVIIFRLLQRLRPKDLMPFDEIYDRETKDIEDARELAEYTILRSHVGSWLRWVLWYHRLLLTPCPSLEELFSPPICNTKWYQTTEDPSKLVYGILWKCYDWVRDPSIIVRSITASPGGFERLILNIRIFQIRDNVTRL